MAKNGPFSPVIYCFFNLPESIWEYDVSQMVEKRVNTLND